jgi:hypothetical protein
MKVYYSHRIPPTVGRGRSQYSARLGIELSGDRIPVGGEIFRTSTDRPWGPPSFLHNEDRVFPGGKEWQGRES